MTMAELQDRVAAIMQRDATNSLDAVQIARKIEDETGQKIDGRSVSLASGKIREAEMT